MGGRILRLAAAALLIILSMPVAVKADSAQANCTLCIVEVQTQGLTSSSEEYVVLLNRTNDAIDLSGIIIKYFTAAGNANTKTIALAGTLAAGSELAFVSDSLKAANPTLGVFPTGLAFADAGGTLQLLNGGAILDQVGWGTATLREGTSAPVHDKGYSLVRQNSALLTDDTGDNSADFSAQKQACYGLGVNEIQPNTIGQDGEDTEQFIELLLANTANLNEDCPVAVNNTTYAIAAGDLAGGPLVAIYQVLDALSSSMPIPLLSSSTNALQFVPESLFGAVRLPGATLSQTSVSAGQSLAKFGTSWKATYSPTPAATNVFSATVPNAAGGVIVDLNACEDVIMTELLPNAVGEDTGNEWIELYNQGINTVFLGDCKVLVNSTEYGFNADQFLDPGEYRHMTDFIDGTSTKTLTLRNTDVNTLSFGRKNTGLFMPLQTIQYENAPEGQSWARFSDGWHWSQAPTPSAENALQGQGASELPPTEFPAPTSTTGGVDEELPSSSAPIQITELLPNPAAPGTDENDEYVELYNPTSEAVNLTGYKVQTGSNYSYSFSLTDLTIPAGGYLLLTSGTTNLTLSNTGGRARLLDPNGAVVSETDAYTEADEGNAWTYVNGTWQWTAVPTPATTNVFIQPVVVSKTKTSSAKTPKTSAKKAVATKAATTKATKGASTAKNPATTAVAEDASTTQPSVLHPGIIAGVALLAVGYAAYEYRGDIANRYYQFKRYRAARRTSGK